MLPAIASVKAATLESPPMEEQQNSSNLVTNSRFNELKRGINVSHWFAQVPYFDPNKYTDEDFDRIKNLGFEHIRLPVDASFLLDENNPQVLNAEKLNYFDTALNKIQAHDLSVVIDIRLTDEFKQRLATEDAFVDTFSQFWGTLAGHLSSRDPEQVFLETLNEPGFGYFLAEEPTVDAAERWNQVQEKLISAIREKAPNHTVIAKGYDWDGIEGLSKLTPLADENVVYNIHFYAPMLFTHQGAAWIEEDFSYLKNLPYPYNLEACGAAVAAIDNQNAKKWAQKYCDQEWNAAKLEEQIAEAATWAKEHNVLLSVNEFGVYRSSVRQEDRLNWTRDVRSLLEKYGLGWTYWEYRGGFGLTTKDETGKRIVEEGMVEALGLNQLSPSDPLPPPIKIEIDKKLEEQQPLPPRKIPEPSAIAGFVVLTLTAIRLKRNR